MLLTSIAALVAATLLWLVYRYDRGQRAAERQHRELLKVHRDTNAALRNGLTVNTRPAPEPRIMLQPSQPTAAEAGEALREVAQKLGMTMRDAGNLRAAFGHTAAGHPAPPHPPRYARVHLGEDGVLRVASSDSLDGPWLCDMEDEVRPPTSAAAIDAMARAAGVHADDLPQSLTCRTLNCNAAPRADGHFCPRCEDELDNNQPAETIVPPVPAKVAAALEIEGTHLEAVEIEGAPGEVGREVAQLLVDGNAQRAVVRTPGARGIVPADQYPQPIAPDPVCDTTPTAIAPTPSEQGETQKPEFWDAQDEANADTSGDDPEVVMDRVLKQRAAEGRKLEHTPTEPLSEESLPSVIEAMHRVATTFDELPPATEPRHGTGASPAVDAMGGGSAAPKPLTSRRVESPIPIGWVTVADAAEIIGKAEVTISGWCKAGKLTVRKHPAPTGHGWRYIISQASIDERMELINARAAKRK